VASVYYPNYPEAAFFILELNPHNVASLQLLLDSREFSAMPADVAGIGLLEEGPTVRTHTENANGQVDIGARFGTIGHSASFEFNIIPRSWDGPEVT
jgi:hypothetical protein